MSGRAFRYATAKAHNCTDLSAGGASRARGHAAIRALRTVTSEFAARCTELPM